MPSITEMQFENPTGLCMCVSVHAFHIPLCCNIIHSILVSCVILLQELVVLCRWYIS
uniref:Uncharacterized protein n=1 Tax=Rhizophora mucronata TaxID=61149 RepID=A0A2P2PGV7_RHIMU